MDHLARVQSILRLVMDEPTLHIDEATDMTSMEGWDSVVTIQVVLALEQEFGVRFATDEVAAIRSVADLLRLLDKYS